MKQQDNQIEKPTTQTENENNVQCLPQEPPTIMLTELLTFP